MILWKLSMREIRSHKGRAFLTAASIVIGVAAVVAVNLAAANVRLSFGAMQSTIGGEKSLQVEAPGESLFDESAATELAEVPGVEAAIPVFERLTKVFYGEDQSVSLSLTGIDPENLEKLRNYEFADGKIFAEGDEVVLDAAFAEGMGLGVNDEVRLFLGRERRTMTITGLLRPKTGAAVAQGSMMFMRLSTAQVRLGRRGQVNQIQIMLEKGADPKQVEAEIASRLPVGLGVRSAAVHSEMGEETMRSLQSALRLATWFALLAAVFIVANAFFMNVTQRQRQLAVMRAIGATRWQVGRLIFREAILLAMIGTVLGILAGWAGAYLLSVAMGQLFGSDLPIPELTAPVVGLAIGFGVGVALLGVLLPAWKAAKVQPIEGMREVSKADVEGVPAWFVTFGLIGFFVSGGLLAANLLGFLPGFDYVLGAIIFLVFAVPVLPAALQPLSQAASFLVRPFGRAQARIARQQLLRRRVRTTLTIGVLFVASSTGLGLASTVIDNINDVKEWYRRVMAGDFFIRSMTPDLASWDSPQVPDGVEEEVKAVRGITIVYAVRFVTGEAEGERVMFTARDFPPNSVTGDLKAISPEDLRQKLLQGEVTIGSVLAQRTGLRPGDDITLETLEGPKEKRIAAIINDYMGGGLVVHMDRQVASRELGIEGATAIVIRADPAQRDEVEQELKAIAQKYGLLFQSYAQLTREIDNMMAGVIGGLWVVMVLGLVVAALGVTNTLSMNVLEQTRELAMLRVVAMTRRQARRTIISQAAIVGVIGLLPGVFVGVGLSWLINRSLMATIGREVSYGFHPWLGVAGLGVSMALVVFAAWIPAQRAANLEPIQALRYE
jgi:putative ABC transport system permease protein